MTKYAKLGIKICLWLLALTPLILDSKVFFPYISGKDFFIQILTIILAVFVFVLFYNDESRPKLLADLSRAVKNPISVSVLFFFLSIVLSLIFSPDRYMSFWGRLSRADGVSSYFFLAAIFISFGVFFAKKDWLTFFKLSLFVSPILAFIAIYDYSTTGLRPDSLIGNPAFMAGYMLFSLVFSLIIYIYEKNYWWKGMSIFSGVLAFISIFISQTRGTILGLFAGILIAIIVVFFRKFKELGFLNKKVLLWVILFLLILSSFGLTVFLTRNKSFWNNIPGISRLVSLDLATDKSASSRLLLYKEALSVSNPTESGWGKFLLGWGQENFMFVSAENYIPRHYLFEISWFDRVHNKVLDTFISNGILGVISYLSIWLCFLYALWRRKDLGFAIKTIILSWATAFFVHLFFLFDQIATSILFFAVLSFVSTTETQYSENESSTSKFSWTHVYPATIFAVILFTCIFVFFYQTVPKYLKMREYTSLIKTKNLASMDAGVSKLFKRETNTDGYILLDYLKVTGDVLATRQDSAPAGYFANALKLSEEYVGQRPEDFLFLVPLASSYTKNGKLLSNGEYLKRGEELFARILEIAPNRPEMNRGLASNLFYQGRYDEAFKYFEKSFSLLPEYWAKEDKANVIAYTKFIQYFYSKKDSERFVQVANRLIENNYSGSASLKQMIAFIETNGRMPVINFN